jgi:hypothetical protein
MPAAPPLGTGSIGVWAERNSRVIDRKQVILNILIPDNMHHWQAAEPAEKAITIPQLRTTVLLATCIGAVRNKKAPIFGFDFP